MKKNPQTQKPNDFIYRQGGGVSWMQMSHDFNFLPWSYNIKKCSWKDSSPSQLRCSHEYMSLGLEIQKLEAESSKKLLSNDTFQL